MKDKDKTKEQLIKELAEVRQKNTELEASKTGDIEKGLGILADNSTIGIYVVQDGRFRFVNSIFQKYVGYKEEELMGMDSLSVVWPGDRDMVRENAVKMLKGERSSPYEFRYVNKDGECLWVMETVISVQYQGRRSTVGNFMDITEQKQAEEKYRRLLEDMNDGYVVVQEGKYVFANRRFCEMIRYEPEQVIGMSAFHIMLPADRRAVIEQYERVMRDEESVPERHEIAVMKGDGTVIVVESSAKPIQYEGKPAFYVIVRDITERKRAEDILRESEEKLRLIFESVPEGIVVTDLEGNILDINDGAVHMHGYDTKEELIGQNVIKFFDERDQARAMRGKKNALEGGSRGVNQYWFIRKNGSVFKAAWRAAVLKDTAGQPAGFVAIAVDITEQQKIQEQLILTDRLASIGQLAAGIAHEINNPLTGVIGFSELLLEKDVPDEIREDLETIDKEAKRVANVVKGLLTFVRSKGTEKTLVDINSIVQEVLQLRSYEQRVNNLEVYTRLTSDLPYIIANGAQMQQVFMNLIVNAEQAMIETNGRGSLNVTTEKAGEMVRVSISDDGPGILPENMKRLFTPFFTTKGVGKGTGLGLSICHGIVAEHSGRICAESEPGKGTSFIVELPVSAPVS